MHFVCPCEEEFENVPKEHGSNTTFPLLLVARMNPMLDRASTNTSPLLRSASIASLYESIGFLREKFTIKVNLRDTYTRTVMEITVGHRTLSEEISKLSDQFYNMVGHDVRAPK